MPGIDHQRLEHFVSCHFSCDFSKTDYFCSDSFLLCVADPTVRSEGIVNIKTWELSELTHCTTCDKLFKMYTLQSHNYNHMKSQFSNTLVYWFLKLENKIQLGCGLGWPKNNPAWWTSVFEIITSWLEQGNTHFEHGFWMFFILFMCFNRNNLLYD